MIKVSVNKDHIKINGHAMFADYGKDIVCAAASSIVITSVNGIDKVYPGHITCEQNKDGLTINIQNHTKEVDALLENMINLLKDLSIDYKKNIQIEEV